MKGLWRSIRFLAVVLWPLWAGACSPPPASDVAAVAPSPQRIVTWAPNLTEAIDALGLSSRLVGTDDFSRHTPEIAALPKLGGLFNPNLELLASIRPDLVLVLPSSRDVSDRAQALGIPVLVVRSEELSDVEEGLRTIATRCGVPERGVEIAARLHRELEPRAVATGTRVLLIAGRSPGRLSELVAAGPGTFLSALVERLGAVNVIGDVTVRWPQIGAEEIVARRPDVIIELSSEPLSEEARAHAIADWNVLEGVPAVANRRVEIIDGDFTLVPGPRLGRLYREFERVLVAADRRP